MGAELRGGGGGVVSDGELEAGLKGWAGCVGVLVMDGRSDIEGRAWDE